MEDAAPLSDDIRVVQVIRLFQDNKTGDIDFRTVWDLVTPDGEPVATVYTGTRDAQLLANGVALRGRQ